MDDLGTRLLYWLTDETNLSLLLFGVAMVLGVVSLVLYFVSNEQSPTQIEFGLLVAAMTVLFYMTLRNSTF
ncbi:hypothetical protein [Haladaptatus sp. NG-WS-4]